MTSIYLIMISILYMVITLCIYLQVSALFEFICGSLKFLNEPFFNAIFNGAQIFQIRQEIKDRNYFSKTFYRRLYMIFEYDKSIILALRK